MKAARSPSPRACHHGRRWPGPPPAQPSTKGDQRACARACFCVHVSASGRDAHACTCVGIRAHAWNAHAQVWVSSRTQLLGTVCARKQDCVVLATALIPVGCLQPCPSTSALGIVQGQGLDQLRSATLAMSYGHSHCGSRKCCQRAMRVAPAGSEHTLGHQAAVMALQAQAARHIRPSHLYPLPFSFLPSPSCTHAQTHTNERTLYTHTHEHRHTENPRPFNTCHQLKSHSSPQHPRTCSSMGPLLSLCSRSSWCWRM